MSACFVFKLLTARFLNPAFQLHMVSWTQCLHSGCAVVVSVGQKGSTLREDVKTYSPSVT